MCLHCLKVNSLALWKSGADVPVVCVCVDSVIACHASEVSVSTLSSIDSLVVGWGSADSLCNFLG